MTARVDHRPYYVTTAIPYVNSTPHVGFAMELLQADVLARYHRAAGRRVRFLCGTDENSLKNARAAAAEGVPTEQLVERNARAFDALGATLDLSRDDFIRTSADPRHRPGVEALWHACARAGDIYKGVYEGLYCVGCEQFWRKAELVDGVCPEHRVAPEPVREPNYFFRLTRYAPALLERIETEQLRIVPAKRGNEVRSFLERGVEDISISRSKARALGWGIPVPGDPDQVVFVWFDALVNYISALGFPDREAQFRELWTDAETVHVIGKGITRFHAVYWPAFLLSAGLALPDTINVHGYVTAGRQKIGKALGNAVDPDALVGRFGVDAVRYFLLRHIRTRGDGEYSDELLARAHDSELADGLGNLLARTVAMIARHASGQVPLPGPNTAADSALTEVARALPSRIDEHVQAFRLSDALAAIWEVVDAANRYIGLEEPWKLAKQASEAARLRLHTVLHHQVGALNAIAAALEPFLPGAAGRIRAQLNPPIGSGPPLFPKISAQRFRGRRRP